MIVVPTDAGIVRRFDIKVLKPSLRKMSVMYCSAVVCGVPKNSPMA